MAARPSLASLVRFAVTPRFEVFYALRALDEGVEVANRWRQQTERVLPNSFRAAAARVAPRPMMWPLLADSLRDAKPDPTFAEMLEAITSLDDAAFQRAVISGVFRSDKIVNDVIQGRQTLGDAVNSQAGKGKALLQLIGLYPFQRSGTVAGAFARIVSQPAQYRAELSNTLDTFWNSAFNEDWKKLEPRMKRRNEAMETTLVNSSLSEFAGAAKLPVIFDDINGTVSSGRGAPMFRYRNLRAINIIPSAFNDSRFWGSYADSGGSLRLFFPVFDPELLGTATARSERLPSRAGADAVDPALLFRALGDTTRYAMASVLARSPRTSVELAKEFGVSKATISHHVQVLRAAGLLQEKGTDKGISLSLDRHALEEIASGAARAMFATDQAPVIRRSRHETGKRKPSAGAREQESSSRRSE